jgi:hypothetical protein
MSTPEDSIRELLHIRRVCVPRVSTRRGALILGLAATLVLAAGAFAADHGWVVTYFTGSGKPAPVNVQRLMAQQVAAFRRLVPDGFRGATVDIRHTTKVAQFSMSGRTLDLYAATSDRRRQADPRVRRPSSTLATGRGPTRRPVFAQRVGWVQQPGWGDTSNTRSSRNVERTLKSVEAVMTVRRRSRSSPRGLHQSATSVPVDESTAAATIPQRR